jgi:hypothetical protein
MSYTIVVVLDNLVKIVERTKTYTQAHELKDTFEKKYKNKIKEVSIVGSDSD